MKQSNMIFDQRPVSHPLGGLLWCDQKVKIQLLQNMVMLHIILKGITKCGKMVAVYFAGRLPLPHNPRGMAPKGQN